MENRKADRPHNSAQRAGESGSGDQMTTQSNVVFLENPAI